MTAKAFCVNQTFGSGPGIRTTHLSIAFEVDPPPWFSDPRYRVCQKTDAQTRGYKFGLGYRELLPSLKRDSVSYAHRSMRLIIARSPR